MTAALRVLHLEDNPRDAQIVRDRLELDGVLCEILVASDKRRFETALAEREFDIIISDYNLPDYDGVAALKHAQAVRPDIPVIILSGTVGEEEAVRCLHIGATDYLLKERLDRLASAVLRAMTEAESRRTRTLAERRLREREQALVESEERTRFALAAARMGVWEIDIRLGRLTWSATMAPLFGITLPHAPTNADEFFQLVHPGDRPGMEAFVGRTIAGERDLAVEFRAVWPDATAHWIHSRAEASYDTDGTPVRVLGVAMDINERRILEEQFRQSQKLEAVGQLAGGIAHDFNNVLTVILGFSELRLMEMPADDPGRADLLEIKKAGSRAAGLTRQLLAFSRKQILQPEVLDLNALIGGVEPMLRLLIAEHIELSVTLTAECALIKIDPTQVEQILVNLTVNAADAMPRGGRFAIETRAVTLDEHYRQRHLPVSPGAYVMLTVSDTGSGMTDEVSQRIFEPFFTTKDAGKGTGLGLATVYGIVKQSDGDISVASAVGRGTTFTIYLPLALEAEAGITVPDRPDDGEDCTRCTETILLVEDDDGVRLLTRMTLERVGYHVLQAGNPRAAAALAAEFDGTIHLLLSDVIMPESDGPPLVERLVLTRPQLRVLYMSGYADEAIRHVLLIEGTPFLQKPFTCDALTRKVRDVLDGVLGMPG